MKNIRYVIGIIFISTFISCTSNQVSRDASNYTIPVNNFSQTVEMLISNDDFLEEEILKINAHNPSVQRILMGADAHLMKRKYTDFHSFIYNTLEEIQFFLQICKLGWNTNFSQKLEISLFSLQFNFYLNERITHL